MVLDAAAIAALTWLVGWWGVVVAALALGIVHRRHGGRAAEVALAAALAWGVLLGSDLLVEPGTRLLGVLGGVLGVPVLALVAITLAFPALLAWATAAVTADISRRFAR
jgi:hypothetical protein